MAYATIPDMIGAYGERELIQFSTPDGADMAGVDEGRVQAALDAASSIMDSFLRRRYAAPVPTSPELRTVCADIARYRLALVGGGNPTDSVKAARNEGMAWLESVARGDATLDGVEPIGVLSGARTSDRLRSVTGQEPHGW